MPRYFDDLTLGSIELFCLTARRQGFTAAAKDAGLTAAAVSRSVARLEARLGVRLFVRTTRRVRLTDAGQRYYAQCQQALDQLVEAEREVGVQQQQATGLVRISLPTSYGHYRVLPLMPDFARQYPAIELELQLSNHDIDFTIAGFDLLGPVTLARVGAGLAQTYRFLVEGDLRAGRLVEVLPDCAGASRPFSLLYPANRHLPLRVRAFIDFLAQRLAAR